MKQSVDIEINDYELVKRALLKPDDFSYLIEKYEAKLFRYIQRTLFVNKEDTEDLLQEVFIKTYRNLNSYNPKYKFSSWIYRITYNTCISHYRKHQKNKEMQTVKLTDKDISKLVSDDDIENEAIQEFDKKMVNDALAKLADNYRNAIVLKYIEEMDYAEISAVMQIPTGSVGSLINRGKAILKNYLQDYGKTK